MRFDIVTRFIANLLWSAHIAADPDYTATPGMSVEDSQDAAATLCNISHGGVWHETSYHN